MAGVPGKDLKRFVVPVSAALPIGVDRTVAPALSRTIYREQKKSAARTDYVEFPGLPHFLVGEPGNEKVAAYVIDWADGLGK